MDAYIKAVEEIGFVKNKQQYGDGGRFHQKGIELTIIDGYSGFAICTEKITKRPFSTHIDHWVFEITESTLPLAIRAIVRFWAKNGVKLNKKGETKNV
jgi:hypothetical protein